MAPKHLKWVDLRFPPCFLSLIRKTTSCSPANNTAHRSCRDHVQWDLLYRFAGGPTRTARIAQALSGTVPTPSVRCCQCPFAPPAFWRPKPAPCCVLCSCCFPSPTPCLQQCQDTYHCQHGAAEPPPRCGGDLNQGAQHASCLDTRRVSPLQINQPSAMLLSRGIPCFQCFSMLL